VTSNDRFQIRVSVFPDASIGFIADSFYLFESTSAISKEWQEVLRIQMDDPDPLPRENVRFVGEKIAYVFLGRQLAVTTDAGSTWARWDALTDQPNWSRTRPLIQDVEIGPDGRGKMTLRHAGTSAQSHLLTRDYGRMWTE